MTDGERFLGRMAARDNRSGLTTSEKIGLAILGVIALALGVGLYDILETMIVEWWL